MPTLRIRIEGEATVVPPCSDLRHTVTWQGNPHLKALEGRELRLRFHLQRAKLFSFRFQD